MTHSIVPATTAPPSITSSITWCEHSDALATEWDAFVQAQPGWTHYHRYGWRTVMHSVFDHECPYLIARDAHGQLEGVLPLVRVRSALFGHFLVSMPFLNYGGPLGTPSAIGALAAVAADFARNERATLLELRSRVPLPVSLRASTRKITVVRALPGEPGSGPALWKSLASKVRSQIKRSQTQGVRVEFGLNQVGPFYRVFSHHMRDLGTPVLPRTFFEAIAATFPKEMWVGCAYHGEQPIAAGCGFQWGNEFEITWASALRSHGGLAPNMALYWAFLERAADAGLSRFDFGRCTPDSGTHKFKRQWDGKDEQLWWYGASQTGAASKTPSPDDAAYAWGPRLWKRLPVGIATAIGPRIVKYIP